MKDMILKCLVLCLMSVSLAQTAADSAYSVTTTLTSSATKADLMVVKGFLGNDADVDAVTGAGLTPLMIFSRYGHVEVVKYLLGRNANINAVTKNGMTALMFASQNDHSDVAKILLDHNANIHALDVDGNTALSFAAKSFHCKTFELLVTFGARKK